MEMRVDQAWNDGTSVELNHLCGRADKGGDLRVRADCGEAAVTNGDRFGDAPGGVHSDHAAAAKNEVGWLGRTAASGRNPSAAMLRAEAP